MATEATASTAARRSLSASRKGTAVEFYAGVGGLSYALESASSSYEVVAAFDVSPQCQAAYTCNRPAGPAPSGRSLASLPAGAVDKLGAELWLMSPPCQPYTRNGKRKGASDARAESFARLFDEVLPALERPPARLLVENVVGFELSETRHALVARLHRDGYAVREFVLSPLQFGVPYSRPRYFLLAKARELGFLDAIDPPLDAPPSTLPPPRDAGEAAARPAPGSEPTPDLTGAGCRPVRDYLDARELGGDEAARAALWAEHAVPAELVRRNWGAMDVVTPDSTRCCCFTKSYGRFVKGAGSVLAREAVPPGTPPEQAPAVRYFTPSEVAALHSFPAEFSFPEDITLAQRYSLLGNSLSVAVLAPLVAYLLADQAPP